MARVTPQQAATKWQQRLSAAGQQIQEGVQAVSVAPGAKAAAAADLWLRRTTEAQGKWKQRVASVSLPEWQDAMIRNIPRIAQGAQQKVGKVEAFMGEFLPYLDQGKAKVDAMPKGGVEESIARAATMIRHNADFKRRG